jgi:hypothetical protein
VHEGACLYSLHCLDVVFSETQFPIPGYVLVN